MRTEFCRKHIDAVAEGCDLNAKYVREVKAASEFADQHSGIPLCSTEAIITLMRIPDKEVKNLTIRHVENRLSGMTRVLMLLNIRQLRIAPQPQLSL